MHIKHTFLNFVLSSRIPIEVYTMHQYIQLYIFINHTFAGIDINMEKYEFQFYLTIIKKHSFFNLIFFLRIVF